MPYAYMAGDNCYRRGDYYRGDYYRGDPGLLSGIGHFLGGAFKAVSTVANVALNPAGAIAGAIVKAGSRALAPHPGGTALAPVPTPLQLTAPVGQGMINLASPSFMNMQIGPGVAGGGGGGMIPVPTAGGGVAMVPCSIKGTHLNKHGYFTHREGWVPPLSKCVKNRRMNVANGHALRRAIRRVTGFGKTVKRMKRAIARANSAVGNVHHARKKTRR